MSNISNNISNNLDASQDHVFKLPIEKDNMFSIHIVYSGFVGVPIDSQFSVDLSNENPPNNSFPLSGLSATINDANGQVFFANSYPIKAEFIVMKYLANNVSAGSFNVVIV